VKRTLVAVGVLASGLLVFGCSGGDEATEGDGTFVGADGVASVVADTSRIVSLSGDLTEIIFELDLGDSVVGVDITTVYPEEAASLPVVGIGRFLTAEGVLAQQPTLVIGDTQTDPLTAIEQIRAAGVPVVILEIPTTFEGLYDKMRRIGDVLDVPDAARRLTDRVKGEVDAALAIAADADLKRMAYVYTRGPDVLLLFGEGMVSNPLIEGAAGIDAGAESGIEGTIPVTAEALVAAAPEVIIVPEEGYGILGGLDAFLALPGVAQTPAGESGAVYAYPEGDFLTFGPRVAESLRRLIEDVHGLP
jgi:iron complex transport system substrate-binding protein